VLNPKAGRKGGLQDFRELEAGKGPVDIRLVHAMTTILKNIVVPTMLGVTLSACSG